MSKLSNPTATLRQASELVAHGLAPAAALPDLEQVAARYAVAVTPDIAALIEPDSRRRSDRTTIHSECGGTGKRAGRERRSDRGSRAFACYRHRASLSGSGPVQVGSRLRGVLPVLFPS